MGYYPVYIKKPLSGEGKPGEVLNRSARIEFVNSSGEIQERIIACHKVFNTQSEAEEFAEKRDGEIVLSGSETRTFEWV